MFLRPSAKNMCILLIGRRYRERCMEYIKPTPHLIPYGVLIKPIGQMSDEDQNFFMNTALLIITRDSPTMRLQSFSTFKFQKAHKVIHFFPFSHGRAHKIWVIWGKIHIAPRQLGYPCITRRTRMPVLWEKKPPPHDYPYYWFVSDPKSKQDRVRVTTLKNLPKIQIF